jgi:hypothetical protein
LSTATSSITRRRMFFWSPEFAHADGAASKAARLTR